MTIVDKSFPAGVFVITELLNTESVIEVHDDHATAYKQYNLWCAIGREVSLRFTPCVYPVKNHEGAWAIGLNIVSNPITKEPEVELGSSCYVNSLTDLCVEGGESIDLDFEGWSESTVGLHDFVKTPDTVYLSKYNNVFFFIYAENTLVAYSKSFDHLRQFITKDNVLKAYSLLQELPDDKQG